MAESGSAVGHDLVLLESKEAMKNYWVYVVCTEEPRWWRSASLKMQCNGHNQNKILKM